MNKEGCEKGHERGCPHGVVCERCDGWLPKSRSCFPWGSKKPKICVSCIDELFRASLRRLAIDWETIEHEVNEA